MLQVRLKLFHFLNFSHHCEFYFFCQAHFFKILYQTLKQTEIKKIIKNEKYVTLHGKTDTNTFLLNGLEKRL